jgi:glycolate oxidase FAD binding subunit
MEVMYVAAIPYDVCNTIVSELEDLRTCVCTKPASGAEVRVNGDLGQLDAHPLSDRSDNYNLRSLFVSREGGWMIYPRFSDPIDVLAPSSVEELREVIGDIYGKGVGIVPIGGGTSMGLGMPPSGEYVVLRMGGVRGVLDLDPGNLTISALAGTTISELRRAIGERQFLALDPPDPERATVGGVISAGVSGPIRHMFGDVRHQVLEIEVIGAYGRVIRGGRKVIKNVAGYDLTKLYVGSLGTLGVISSVTLRLRPKHERSAVAVIPLSSMEECEGVISSILDSDLSPSFLELWTKGLDPIRLPVEDGFRLSLGFEGLEEEVSWQLDELSRISKKAMVFRGEEEDRLRYGIAQMHGSDGFHARCRISVLSSELPWAVDEALGYAERLGIPCEISAHAGIGVIRAHLMDPQGLGREVDFIREMAIRMRRRGKPFSIENAPLRAYEEVDPWGNPGPSIGIMRRIKRGLDPEGLFNRGRFVGGL